MPELEKYKPGKKELIELVRNHLLFLDQYDVPHIFFMNTDRFSVKIESRQFKSWLRANFFENYHVAASKEALEESINHIFSQALTYGKLNKFNLRVRFSHIDEESYLDLRDEFGRVIKITAHELAITEPSIPLFRQFKEQKPIALPFLTTLKMYREEHFEIFFTLIPVKNVGDRVLLIAWIVSILISNKPKPILCFHGPKGSGKSSASEVIKMLLDPSENPRIHVSNERDLALSLYRNGILLLDNKTVFRDDIVNLLCMAVTKGSYVTRELYSNDEMTNLDFHGAVIINGINVPTHRPDLLERLMMIELEPISNTSRKTEKDLLATFETYKDDFLRQFIDVAVEVKKMKWSGYKCRDEKPRLADFYEIGEMVAVILGYPKDEFQKIFAQNEQRQELEILEKPLFQVIRKFITENKVFSGTATELFQKLQEFDENVFKKSLRRVNENSLGRFINEHIASFEKIGIHIEKQKTSEGRIVHFTYTENPPSSLSFLPDNRGEKDSIDNNDNGFGLNPTNESESHNIR